MTQIYISLRPPGTTSTSWAQHSFLRAWTYDVYLTNTSNLKQVNQHKFNLLLEHLQYTMTRLHETTCVWPMTRNNRTSCACTINDTHCNNVTREGFFSWAAQLSFVFWVNHSTPKQAYVHCLLYRILQCNITPEKHNGNHSSTLLFCWEGLSSYHLTFFSTFYCLMNKQVEKSSVRN